MHLHHAYGNNAYPVIPAGQVLPADESARFDMGITHIFKVNGDKLRRADAELCEFPFNQFQHDRFPAAVNTDHGLDQLRPNKRANALHINCDELFVINQRFPKNIHTCTKDIAEQFDLKQAIKIPNLLSSQYAM